ncbi:MAG: hypothetical protein QM617_05705 [Comamonas sp.]
MKWHGDHSRQPRRRCAVAALAALAVALAGCAASPEARYASADCTELAQEAQQAQRTLVRYSGGSEDQPIARAPGFLLWPAFAFLEEQRGRDSRYEALRQRYAALARSSAAKSCPVARPLPVNQAGVPRVPWTADQALGEPGRSARG